MSSFARQLEFVWKFHRRLVARRCSLNGRASSTRDRYCRSIHIRSSVRRFSCCFVSPSLCRRVDFSLAGCDDPSRCVLFFFSWKFRFTRNYCDDQRVRMTSIERKREIEERARKWGFKDKKNTTHQARFLLACLFACLLACVRVR